MLQPAPASDSLMTIRLRVLDDKLNIHRLEADAPLPAALPVAGFWSVTRTGHELSIVCSDRIRLASQRCERGWACLQVVGPLDFSLTGVMSGLSRVLADAGISLFAISTFDTDYLLVREGRLGDAVSALNAAGYVVE